MRPCHGSGQKGFTLIELSIVLLIIGLIIGGILVGQDLIQAAQIRSTLAQIEKFNSEVNAFRSKYNGIPGDLASSTTRGFQLFTFTNPAIGFGDGNGLIEGGAAGSVLPQGETLAFWRHMSEANLMDGNYGLVGNSALDATTGKVTGDVIAINETFPPAAIGRGNSIAVYADSGYNYYQIINIRTVTTAPDYTFGTDSLSPVEAYNFDAKIDDGLPNTGSVRARGISAMNAAPSFHAGSQADSCTNGATASDTASTYNLVLMTGGNDSSCSVRFRFN